MTTLRCAATAVAVVVPALAVACASSGDPAAKLEGVDPASAHNDLPVTLVVRGGPFRPAYQVNLSSAAASPVASAYALRLAAVGSVPRTRVTATSVEWLSTELLAARLPAGVAPGAYDVELVDPRGSVATRANAFVSLGPDESAPAVELRTPGEGAVQAAATEVAALVWADDGAGTLHTLSFSVTGPAGPLASGTCVVPTDAHATPCTFSFPTPATAAPFDETTTTAVDELVIHAEATDAAGNRGEATRTLPLAPRPIANNVGPRFGPARGGTSFAIFGENFVPGTPGTEILMNGTPIDTTVTSGMVLSGKSPTHDPGSVQLSVRTGAAVVPAGGFEFFAAPIVRMVTPSTGAIAGGTKVIVAGNNFRGQTRVVFGEVPPTLGDTTPAPAELACAVVISESRIEGVAPAGFGKAFVTANDPIGGDGEMGVLFSFSDAAPVDIPTDGGCSAGDGGAGP